LRYRAGIEPAAGANPSRRQAVVHDDRQQAAGTSDKGNDLIRTGRRMLATPLHPKKAVKRDKRKAKAREKS
jgi:hypothetical protein